MEFTLLFLALFLKALKLGFPLLLFRPDTPPARMRITSFPIKLCLRVIRGSGGCVSGA